MSPQQNSPPSMPPLIPAGGGQGNYNFPGNGIVSSASTVATVLSSFALPVQAATIAANRTPINTQQIGSAPDGSGKTMFQYEALIGIPDYAFSNSWNAQQAIVSAATLAGCINFVLISSQDSLSCRMMCW